MSEWMNKNIERILLWETIANTIAYRKCVISSFTCYLPVCVVSPSFFTLVVHALVCVCVVLFVKTHATHRMNIVIQCVVQLWLAKLYNSYIIFFDIPRGRVFFLLSSTYLFYFNLIYLWDTWCTCFVFIGLSFYSIIRWSETIVCSTLTLCICSQ